MQTYTQTDKQCDMGTCVKDMGVNQGGQGELDPYPTNLKWGTLMQIVPPDFVTFQNFKDQIAPSGKLNIFHRSHGQDTTQNIPKHAISSDNK